MARSTPPLDAASVVASPAARWTAADPTAWYVQIQSPTDRAGRCDAVCDGTATRSSRTARQWPPAPGRASLRSGREQWQHVSSSPVTASKIHDIGRICVQGCAPGLEWPLRKERRNEPSSNLLVGTT